jgi:colanic acid/amylovoran biosynthesis glycosyltransferase
MESRAVARSASVRHVTHVIPEYLPRSAQFIHTLLRHQTRSRPVVLTHVVSHLDEFPIERVTTLDPTNGIWRLLDRGLIMFRGYGASAARGISTAISHCPSCVVHAHFGWSGRDSVAAARDHGIPLVTTFYGRDLTESERARRNNPLRPSPYRRLFRDGAVFIVEGPAMADHLSRIGCPRERIRIVPIGVDLRQFAYQPRPRNSRFIVVQAARFVEKKGFDITIRAFAEARADIGSSELWLIGDGPLAGELAELAAELGIADAVRFHGMVSHETYRSLMAKADLCVQPSRTARDGDTEGGAPTVLLEMQALGVPVTATVHADIPFVVARSDELIPENDVPALAAALVERALESTRERNSRLADGRALVERQHDAVVTSGAVERVYDEALA